WLRSTLGDQAKTWLYIGIIIGFLLLGAGLGRWIISAPDRLFARVYQAATGLFVLAVTLLFLIDRNQLEDAFLMTVASLAVAAFVFAWITYAMLRPALGTEDPSRRIAIGVLIGGIAAAILGRDTWQLWQRQSAPSDPTSADTVTPAITPID